MSKDGESETPFPVFCAEEVDLPEHGQPVIIATPYEVFRAIWLGEVDGRAWTLTDACRLMRELAEGSEEG